MNLQVFTNDVRAHAPKLASCDHTLKFDLEDMGIIWIDARQIRQWSAMTSWTRTALSIFPSGRSRK